jgi:hypothetical protein
VTAAGRRGPQLHGSLAPPRLSCSSGGVAGLLQWGVRGCCSNSSTNHSPFCAASLCLCKLHKPLQLLPPVKCSTHTAKHPAVHCPPTPPPNHLRFSSSNSALLQTCTNCWALPKQAGTATRRAGRAHSSAVGHPSCTTPPTSQFQPLLAGAAGRARTGCWGAGCLAEPPPPAAGIAGSAAAGCFKLEPGCCWLCGCSWLVGCSGARCGCQPCCATCGGRTMGRKPPPGGRSSSASSSSLLAAPPVPGIASCCCGRCCHWPGACCGCCSCAGGEAPPGGCCTA